MDDRDRRPHAERADDDDSEVDDDTPRTEDDEAISTGSDNGSAVSEREETSTPQGEHDAADRTGRQVRTDRGASTDGPSVDRPSADRPSPDGLSTERPSRALGDDSAEGSLWKRFWNAEDGPLVLLRELAISVAIVLAIGLLLFGLSGVWPPMVAVESASMEPNINQYDLVFVTEPGRFAPNEADDRGIATVERAEPTDYSTFNRAGNVIVYYEPGSVGPPIIHRAHLFVEADENWYDRANPDYLNADSCAALANCPAPYAGYITKGDNENSNRRYDQANGIAPVVRPNWVTGVARVRIPYLGWIRLAATGVASAGPVIPAGVVGIGGGLGYAVVRRYARGRCRRRTR